MEYLKTHRWQILLSLITFFGGIARIINTYTKSPSGDSAHFTLHAVNFLNSGLLVTWDQSTYLWYALTDIFYRLFGITQFTSRFASIIFGTATILLMYLFVTEFSGSRKLGIISSAIYAFTPAFIFHAADEHDISVLFFVLLIFFCLLYGLKHNAKFYILLSGVFFGVASMWKAYVPLFILPYVGFILYYHRKKNFNINEHRKTFLYTFLIIALLVTPTLAYNYLNYKHNQVPTFFFLKFFNGLSNEKTDALYGWVSGGELYRNGTFFSRVFFDGSPGNPDDSTSLLYGGLTYSLYANGHVLVLLSLLGLILLFLRRKSDIFAKDYLFFYLLYFIIPFLFLIDGNILHKHYAHFLAFAIPAVAYLFLAVYTYASTRMPLLKKLEIHPYLVFIIIILYVFFVTLSLVNPTWGTFFSSNPEGKLMDYKIKNIPADSLIIYDDRIYNSLAGWLFNDRLYIPVSSVNQFISYNQNSSQRQSVFVFAVECAIDDCGWGTIHANQPLNNSMEGFFSSLQDQSVPIVYTAYTKISGIPYYNPLITKKTSPDAYYKVYRLPMEIDLQLAQQVKNQYEYFLYPSGYANKGLSIFKQFTYIPEGAFEKLLNTLGWTIFYINIIISFIALLFVIFELYVRL